MPSVTLCGGPGDGVTLDMDYYALLDAPTYTTGPHVRVITHNYYTWDDPTQVQPYTKNQWDVGTSGSK